MLAKSYLQAPRKNFLPPEVLYLKWLMIDNLLRLMFFGLFASMV